MQSLGADKAEMYCNLKRQDTNRYTHTHTHTPPLEVYIETAEKFPSPRGPGGEEDFLLLHDFCFYSTDVSLLQQRKNMFTKGLVRLDGHKAISSTDDLRSQNLDHHSVHQGWQ